MNQSEKTIPYRLSPADLENLRLLRKRMQPPGPSQEKEAQDKTSGTSESPDPEPNPRTQEVEQKSP